MLFNVINEVGCRIPICALEVSLPLWAFVFAVSCGDTQRRSTLHAGPRCGTVPDTKVGRLEMPEGPEQAKVARKLAAILAADIAGYGTLMGPMRRTVADLKSHQAVILLMIGDHGRRIIDTAGGGILAEFASVVSAVDCAVAVQKTRASATLEPSRRDDSVPRT